VRLTQLKLAGFKSFVDPTVVPVSSQLVGVVGPNGCGKSNIIDAVRWVLGESKASELRGESMQDVIFNGSGNRKPAARASVELVFDNSDGRAAGQWSAYAEIAVRRVLTRDGASSYYVNNQQVRRKDVHDIFLGTGLGARGYAIIGQGMINRLIEARPEELRVFLEEAAGVSRYKERRRETENRLHDTRENLSRVEDILRELASQLEKLESQAEVAQTYRALQEEGEQKQHALWYQKESGARAERSQKEVEIEQAQAQLEGAIAQLRAGESRLEGVRQAHYAASDAVHAAQGKLFETNAQVSSLEAEIRHVVDARTRYQTRKSQLDEQIAEWDAQREHCAAQIALAEEELAAGAARIEDACLAVDAARERLPELEARVREDASARDAMRSALARIEQELALAAQAQRDADRQLQVLAERKARLDAELRAIDAPDAGELAQLAGDRNASAAQLDAAQTQLTTLEARLPELDAARAQAQQQAQAEAQTLARLEARLAALTKLQQDVQKQGALEPWLAKHELAGLARLWQTLDIEAGWETALEAVLRERMAGLAVSNLDWARAFAQDPPPARLAFYQLPPLDAAAIVTAPAPASLQALGARLRVTDTAQRALLTDWLAHVYTCPDLAQALAAMSEAAREAYFAAESAAVQVPYLVMGLLVLLWAALIAVVKFPVLRGHSDTHDGARSSTGAQLRALSRQRNFVFAVLTQLFYVGAQVGVWSYLIRYCQDVLPGTPEKTAAGYLSLSLGLFMCGRFVGAALLRRVSAARLLAVFAVLDLILCVIAIVLPGWVGLSALIGVSVFMSVMFPTIFVLGLNGLDDDQRKLGASLLVMAIIGGALLPPLMGGVSDLAGIHWSMAVPAACFGVIVAFALRAPRTLE